MKTLFDNGFTIKDILETLQGFDDAIKICKKNKFDFVTYVTQASGWNFKDFYEMFTAYKTLAN